MKKKHRTTIFLYILIVIIPTILGSYFFIQDRHSKQLQQRIEDAKWVTSIHESYWDNLISETLTSLDMLTMTARTVHQDLEKMKPLLERAQASDPRYGGLFLLNEEGIIVTGSIPQLPLKYFLHDAYIQEVLKTKDTVISNQPFTLVNGNRVIGIASPILNDNKEIEAVTVALLRMDYIENIMKVLTPNTTLLVLNAQNEMLIGFNYEEDENGQNSNWYTMPIDRLPWKIKAKIEEPDRQGILLENLLTIAGFLVLTHILFLSILYKMLQRQAILEKKKSEAQKLELVGTLAASTAHEIRNPLTGIKGLVQLLSEKHNQPDDQFYFSVIHREIERINEIVSEFLILGKPTATKLETEDFIEIIEDIHPLILSEARINHIDVLCHLPPHPVFIQCTKSQMKQVILNIVKNSFEAMKEGGTLSITLKEKRKQCELIITDNGAGIPEEIFEKIFAPFYTSKETGTGLGLVVSQRIIQSFNGEIKISSRENKGTTVSIILPTVPSSM